ncbi:hypothetical protein BC938DRAFT_477992 [Jimgerdemannia flammicorona]|uniref:Uncharacterized protein n=1 Tax=Jimgerdemannia flammicorona TaxID=994334 RepID=A0A433QNM4_9FUNG|nr:hypothetical protein BC938DRAFT_477992 [Jimgerdemannia flammicorona]
MPSDRRRSDVGKELTEFVELTVCIDERNRSKKWKHRPFLKKPPPQKKPQAKKQKKGKRRCAPAFFDIIFSVTLVSPSMQLEQKVSDIRLTCENLLKDLGSPKCSHYQDWCV